MFSNKQIASADNIEFKATKLTLIGSPLYATSELTNSPLLARPMCGT
jgi:hypothetical protein